MTAIDLSGNPNPFAGRLLEDLSAVGNTIDNPPPIPEPEIYALFMAGLGLIAFIARRRKNGQA